MIIGCPKEIKVQEYRVGLTPAGVRELVALGHRVLVEKNAGLGSGIADDQYLEFGAEIVTSAAEVWGHSDMIVKVKEPIEPEYTLMRPGQVVYTYFHLAPAPELARVLIERKVTAIAYETIQLDNGVLPLLVPMSEVAGRMAVQVGASCLEKEHGGKGILLGGVPGVKPANVVILGGGVVGTNAAKMAVGMGADVTILDVSKDRMQYLDDIFGGRVKTLFSDVTNIRDSVRRADLVVGGVLIAGARAPKLVTEPLIQEMEAGSVVVDVAVDQGGCIETCHATTHEHPTYVVHNVIHYCVANMPGAVARTSTFALNAATTPYLRLMAKDGVLPSLKANKPLRLGLNCYKGQMTHPAVASSLGYAYTDPTTLL
jgi:alanine dehydrogenase